MLHVSRHGDRGSELPALPTATVWRAGQEAEVTWQITANHGGGYQVTRVYTHVTRHTCLHTRVQYRLCPADQPLTEACFSKTPLQFNTGKQQLQWNNGTRLHGVISSVSTYIY